MPSASPPADGNASCPLEFTATKQNCEALRSALAGALMV
jgi:hypothetical protein